MAARDDQLGQRARGHKRWRYAVRTTGLTCEIGRDTPLAIRDGVHPLEWHANALRQFNLGDPERLEKLLHQDLTRLETSRFRSSH